MCGIIRHSPILNIRNNERRDLVLAAMHVSKRVDGCYDLLYRWSCYPLSLDSTVRVS
jgi:hypothetical protein